MDYGTLKLAVVPLLLILGLLLERKRILSAKSAPTTTFEEVLNQDTPLILYLRAFEADGVGPEPPPSAYTATIRHFFSYEEELASRLGKMKNFVAVGRPGDDQGQVGAKRLFLEDSRWREKVSILMDRAALILLRPAATKGLLWELSTILERGHIEKLVLVTQFAAHGDRTVQRFYQERFRNLLASRLNLHLQAWGPSSRFGYFQEDMSFIEVKRLTSIPRYRLLRELPPGSDAGRSTANGR